MDRLTERERDEIDDQEVEGYVRGHDRYIDDNAAEWNRFAAAYRTQFWKAGNSWHAVPGLGAELDTMPIRMEVNQVQPFVQAHVSNLFYRAPRAEIEMPAVTEGGPGRKPAHKGAAERVKAFDDEWIRRSDIQECSTYALQLALFHGAAGFKLGTKKKAKGPLDRVWVDVIPRWELLIDDQATSFEQQAYRGHIRYERIDRARELLGDELEDVEQVRLPDVIDDEGMRATVSVGEEHRAKKYVRILEFYDLICEEQRFYLVTGTGASATVTRYGKALPIPYDLPTGRPGVPILPVVLHNETATPLRGIPVVRRVYQINAEQNLLLTIVANGLRRDAARQAAVREGTPSEFLKMIADAQDGAVTIIPDKEWKKGDFFKNITWDGFSSTLDKYAAFLQNARQDSQGMSDIMQGRQGSYLSATEADHLAASGETTTLEIGQRMTEAMARTLEMVHVIVGSELGDDSLSVRTIEGNQKLTREDMLLPWTVGIVDSGTTPVREGKKKKEFLEVAPILMELVAIASAPEPPPAPVLPGQPPAPPQGPTAAQRRMAQLQVDHLVSLWQLPETMSWRALSLVEDEEAAKKKPPTPDEMAAIDALLAKAIPAPAPIEPLPDGSFPLPPEVL